MAHDVFISHSTKDKTVSDAVCAALEGAGIRCWIAPRDVQPGRSFAGEINRAIQHSKVMVLVFSAHSNNSEQVLREVQLAVNSHLHIIQFRIEDVRLNDDLEYFLSTPHWLDALNPPLEDHIDRLVTSIKPLLDLPQESVPSEDRRRPIRESAPPSQPLAPRTSKVSKASVPKRPNKKLLVATVVMIFLIATAWWYFRVFPPAQTTSKATLTDGAVTDKYGPTLLPYGINYTIKDGLRAERYGFIDTHGNVVIEPQWEETFGFHEGVANVKRDGKWGLIDKGGRVLIEPQWQYGFRFYEGLSPVQRDGKHGFIDKTGQIVLVLQWDYADRFSEGVAAITQKGKTGYIDKTGRVVIGFQWDSATSFREGLAPVERDRKWGFIDKNGTLVVGTEWDRTFAFHEGLACVKREEKYGFIDKTGQLVVGLEWDYADAFYDGRALVQRGKKYGFIDKTGVVVVGPQLDGATDFYGGLARVVRNGKAGLIDRNGRDVSSFDWAATEDWYPESEDSPMYWLFARRQGNKLVVVWLDSTGKQIWSSDQTPSPATVKGAETSPKAVAAASKEKPYLNSLGMKFVPVPGTGVLFSIWETRVKDYKVFVEESKREWAKADFEQTEEHPAVNVSWEDATAFCEWLTQSERKAARIAASQSYRLPGDEEWSAAVGLEKESGSTPKERQMKIKGIYPWGRKWPPPWGAGNYDPTVKVDDFAQTSPAGSFAANQNGIYDLGGNVWEWCADKYEPGETWRVLRGASWFIKDPDSLLSSNRGSLAPAARYGNGGFRCVLVVESSR